MLLVARPPVPAGFNGAARAARKKIRDLVAAGERPLSEQFDDEWSVFKHVLAGAQRGRCGYCDQQVLGVDHGTIDHVKPKAEIEALLDDPATWGEESPDSASLPRRKTVPVSATGYHWLAYAWSNYVFACRLCNTSFKKAIYPVAAHPRCCPPRARGREESLLLHCYRELRPSEHLQFNANGTVEPYQQSPYGFETIRTVGLYRKALCQVRSVAALDAHDALRRFAEEEEGALRDLRRLGEAERPFAGVVRAIVEQQLAMTWEEFLDFSDA